MKKAKILLVIIVLLGSILRLYRLGKTPLALEWDEVALGYDAYSIVNTARDQFGQFLPLSFRSIDDYKPPLYVYSTVPSILLFGVTEFSVRFTSAIFGIMAVVLTYFLCVELFWAYGIKRREIMGLLSSFFLAISPWHLQFSRAAFETNLSVTVTIAAVMLFIKGIRNNSKLFLLSAVFFGLALFSYHSTRVVTPLLLVTLFLAYRPKLPDKKILAGFAVIYALFLLLFAPIAVSSDSQIRFRVTNILNFEDNQAKAAQAISQDEKLGALAGGQIFHNRRTAIINYDNIKAVVANYLTHFSPEFLFVRGDVPLHHAPGFGMMYFFDAFLLIIGLLVYLKKYSNRNNLVLFIWLLLGPVPAAVTNQVPHAVRTEIILPTLQIFSALGLFTVLIFIINEYKKTKFTIRLLAGIIVLVVAYAVGSYLHQYYIHTNYELSDKWLYGRKEAVEYLEQNKSRYDRVIVSLSVDMPLNFWLFYSKYPPVRYLKEGGTVSGGFAEERNHFDKYEFHNFKYNDMSVLPEKILFVGTPKDFPSDVKPVFSISYLNGQEAIKIVANHN